MHGNSPPTENERESFGIGVDQRNVTGENELNTFQTTDCSSGDTMAILYEQREQNSTKNRDDIQEREDH